MNGIREIENLWIPMPDGCRLAARVWLPPGGPAPAVVEYIPYRKRDFNRTRDERIHRWFAEHGYAALRIDVRGTGDSEGLFEDEYCRRELEDGAAAITWIAAQPWCSGAVGMIGKSWGGFNALQIAALQPPALKAVISVCASDDRFADDAHYMGGCLLNENLIWGTALMAFATLPPDPEIVGARWQEMWAGRIEALRCFPAEWMRHQCRDAYWRHGSVSEDYSAIRCPVFAVGGWADAYSNAIPRLLANLDVPRKGLVGPWAHLYPHEGEPGPAIGFLQEAKRWWDRWLKGIDNGIEREPAYRVWMQEHERPGPFHPERVGRWVAEERWPSPRIAPRRLWLAPGRLGAERPDAFDLAIGSPQSVGAAAGDWCSFGRPGDPPDDQRRDDALSTVFDTAPLAGRLEILGAPVVELKLDDVRAGIVCARLCDVAPDGTSLRLTYGLLNLAGGDERRIVLNDVAHAFPAGHRIRIALSTAYWPIAWPAGGAAPVVLHRDSALILPVRTPREGDEALRDFDPPDAAPPPGQTEIRRVRRRRRVARDLLTGESDYLVAGDDGAGGCTATLLAATGTEIGARGTRRFRIHDDDPLSARAEVTIEMRLRRPGWEIGVTVDTMLTCSADRLHLSAHATARLGGAVWRERRWNEAVPRETV